MHKLVFASLTAAVIISWVGAMTAVCLRVGYQEATDRDRARYRHEEQMLFLNKGTCRETAPTASLQSILDSLSYERL